MTTFIGSPNNDTYYITSLLDSILEKQNQGVDTVITYISGYTLPSNVENLTLAAPAIIGIGNELNNKITGNAENNTINGGMGADTLIGLSGDDLYFVDHLADSVLETTDQGIDTVITTIENYTLSANTENLTLSGAVKKGAGNSLNNKIIGNLENNTISGGAGIDTLRGSFGNDYYLIDQIGDLVAELSSEGTDTVVTSASGYALAVNIENLILIDSAAQGAGNSLNNVITGNSANNTLSGGAGSDTFFGQHGNDVYTIDNPNDLVVEEINQGWDSILSNTKTYTLPSNVESLFLAGLAIAGVGNSLNNEIIGNLNSNTISGGAGIDTLRGGNGDDSYLVDQVGDWVVELGDEGIDTIMTSASGYTLAVNVENLILTDLAATGFGNSLNNRITGNSTNNTLSGGLGADTLSGENGNDVYIIDGLNDLVIEAVNQGSDTVISSSESYTLPSNIENLLLTGSAIFGTGNALNNNIKGNYFDNILFGATGIDTLLGGLGNDTLIIGSSGLLSLTSSSATERAFINGGGGWNTLKLADASLLDLVAIAKTTGNMPPRLNNIQTIDLREIGTQQVALQAANVQALGQVNLLNGGNANSFGWRDGSYHLSTSENIYQLIIDGTSSDRIIKSTQDVSVGGTWLRLGTLHHNDDTYIVYSDINHIAQIIVHHDVAISANLMKAWSATVELSNITSGCGGFVINGQSAYDSSGGSVSSAGDVNGDGLADLVVGADWSNTEGGFGAGRSYVVFGKTNGQSIEVSTLTAGSNNTAGFVINGQEADDNSGRSVASAGDVNGDGLDDLIIGAPGSSSNVGASYVIFGKIDGSAVDVGSVTESTTTAGFVITGEAAYDNSGSSVASAGDVNGDGLNDLIVGAYASDPYGVTNAGSSYVVFGKTDGHPINLSELASGKSAAGFVIRGSCTSDFSGISVSSAGDVNGDGLADVIIGAYQSDPNGLANSGCSYVIFGKTDGQSFDLSSLTPESSTAGFSIQGSQVGDRSGYAVSDAGDVNGDGLADLLIGAFGSDANQRANAGSGYVVFGKTSGTAVRLSDIERGQGGFTIRGLNANDLSGYSLNEAGDINADGLMDIIIGAHQSDPSGKINAGRSYVVYGKTDGDAVDVSTLLAGTSSAGFTINGESQADNSGFSVSAAGDVNGDGFADLLVGAIGSSPGNQTSSGRSYVIFGGNQGVTQWIFDELDGDFIGTAAAENIVGTTGNNQLIGGAGNDTLSGEGGADVIYGGAGDDFIILANSNVEALSQNGHSQATMRVDGGSGIDTLSIQGTATTLNLTQVLGDRVNSIEVINLASASNHTLVVSSVAVGALTAMNIIHASNAENLGWHAGSFSFQSIEQRHQLIIDGNSGDSVSGIAGDWWESQGTVTRGENTYTVYNSFGKACQLWVDSDISTNLQIPLSATVNLSDVSAGIGGFAVNGNSGFELAGQSVASAGDINGDGFSDIIIGAYQSGTQPRSVGCSYVIFGNHQENAINLSELTGTSPLGFSVSGESAYDWSGFSVASAGDVNGDGLDDLIIGAPCVDINNDISDTGRSYVIFGSPDASSINLNTLTQSQNTIGFTIDGQTTDELSGYSVASAGDVNGDGLADLIIGAVGSHPNGQPGAGRAYVAFGKTDNYSLQLSALTETSTGFVINGYASNDSTGYSVASAGDVNGDGLADLIVGSPWGDPSGQASAGVSYVVFGKTDNLTVETLNLTMGNNTAGFSIFGQSSSDYSGYSVSSAGDVNGDGLADLVIGAYGSDVGLKTNAGRSYVVFGKTDSTPIMLSDFRLNSGTSGFLINGQNTGDRAGYSVSKAGDVNGDGLDDLIIGATHADPAGIHNAGCSYVVFGKTDGIRINLSSLTSGYSQDGFVINGSSDSDHNGWAASSAGDINGDGFSDLLVSVPYSDAPNGKDAGKAFVVFGGSNSITQWVFNVLQGDAIGTEANDFLVGTSGNNQLIGGAGDDTLTGSGGADVLYGGSGNDVITITENNIHYLVDRSDLSSTARIDGGSGFDILRFDGAGLTIDLTKPSTLLKNIESIDLSDSGGNTLKISLASLLNIGEGHKYNLPSSQQMRITGSTEDFLQIEELAQWSPITSITIDGQDYIKYTHATTGSTILIDTDITII